MRPVRVGAADQGELLRHGASIPRGCDNLGPRATEVPLTTSSVIIRPLTGADRIVADTDTGNRPMAAAFERPGYGVTARRIVMT
jgi:hypothetical protein